MQRDDEQTCGDFKCQTCYPGGVIEVWIKGAEKALEIAKSYEM